MPKYAHIPDIEGVAKDYLAGASLADLAQRIGISRMAIGRKLRAFGIPLRTPSERMKNSFREKGYHWSKNPEAKARAVAVISAKALARSAQSAAGKYLCQSGYYILTCGDLRGKYEHVHVMEQRIGRALLNDECVHHIDECKTNNDINNLALMTVVGHGRHHQLQKRADVARA